jgi:hypothetical protein
MEGLLDQERRDLPGARRPPTTPANGLGERRHAHKQVYRDYQQRARAAAAMVNRVLDADTLQVEAHPNVWETEEGAFVEAVIWVPRQGTAE